MFIRRRTERKSLEETTLGQVMLRNGSRGDEERVWFFNNFDLRNPLELAEPLADAEPLLKNHFFRTKFTNVTIASMKSFNSVLKDDLVLTGSFGKIPIV
jgi:hypothetical protein